MTESTPDTQTQNTEPDRGAPGDENPRTAPAAEGETAPTQQQPGAGGDGSAATGEVTDVTSPYDTGTIAKDGHSALVQFDMRGDSDTAGERVEPVLKAVEGVQKDHASLRIEEIGGASMMKTFDDAFGDDFKQAEYSAVPVALGILLIAFGAGLAYAAQVVTVP